MNRIEKRITSRRLLSGAMLAGLLNPLSGQPAQELPVHRIPNLGAGAEFYFAPDSKRIIGNAKREGDSSYHVYTLNIDGTDIRRISDRGEDACSFFFLDGQRLLWTSTRDHPDLPKDNYSAPEDYPQGAELYTSKLDGSDVRRLTNNTVYEAEASVSPDGKWVLFGRQIGGKMDLWKMRPDGSGEVQITRIEGWQPGGALFLPDSKTILFRAWKVADQGQKGSLPVTIFTIHDDGTGLRQVTHDAGNNWAPHPAPDGRHFAFVKVLPPRNYEIYLGDLDSVGIVNICRVSAAAYQPREAAFLRSLSLPLGALLAHSTVRVKLESEVEELSRKLADRKLLDRAKGLLQASYQWTEEQAYLHIRLTSRQRRTPMRDIAREIIDLAGSAPGRAQ
jgi:TolB protein